MEPASYINKVKAGSWRHLLEKWHTKNAVCHTATHVARVVKLCVHIRHW